MKAILVLDEMPKGCVCCPCSDDEDHFCRAKSEYYSSWKRPSWCPLKKMPKKRILPRSEVENTNYGEEPWFSDGWNECLEEIEK